MEDTTVTTALFISNLCQKNKNKTQTTILHKPQLNSEQRLQTRLCPQNIRAERRTPAFYITVHNDVYDFVNVTAAW